MTHRRASPAQHNTDNPDRMGPHSIDWAFSHVALVVSDLERSLAFYRDGLLGKPGRIYHAAGRRVASLMGIPSSGFRGVFLRYGQAHLELLEYPQKAEQSVRQRDPRDIGFAHVSLIVPDAGEMATELAAHGGAVLAQFSHSFGGAELSHIAFIADPDHNRIELISHPDFAEESAHAQFLGCEQVGWPVKAEV